MANNYLVLRGGSERVMYDETAWLRAHGHTVSLFGRADPGDLPDIPYRELMPPLQDYSSVPSAGRFRLAWNIIYNHETGKRFRSFLELAEPDIVHCHNIYAGLTTAVIDECERAGIPCVVTLHDYKLACPSYLMLREGKPCSLCIGGRFYHCALTRCHKSSYAASAVSTVEAYFNQGLGKYLKAKKLIAPSRFLLEQMLAGGVPTDKLHHLPNGINLPARDSKPYGQRYCLYLGRLSPEKGVRTLLSAMTEDLMPLRLAGDGPIAADLKLFAEVEGLRNVQFEGQCSGEKLLTLLKGAAFVIVPSEWYENASMTVLEAMANGKPVIASRIGGLPEQIEDNVTGILVEPGNVSELRHAIATLAFNTEFRKSLGQAARSKAESRFSLDVHCNSLLGVYEAAIESEKQSLYGGPLP